MSNIKKMLEGLKKTVSEGPDAPGLKGSRGFTPDPDIVNMVREQIVDSANTVVRRRIIGPDRSGDVLSVVEDIMAQLAETDWVDLIERRK